MLDRLEFLLGEAMTALRRNAWMTFAAITTAAMALFLLGGLGYAYLGLAHFVQGLGDKSEVKIFLKDSIPTSEARALRAKILAIPGTQTVRFVSREDGLREFAKDNPNVDVNGLFKDNPLPNSYVIRVKDISNFNGVVAALKALPEVEKDGVKFAKAEQDFLSNAMRAVPWLGVTLGGVMLLTSGVLIYNAIRLTILARRREIRIMQLVGATRGMVWTPMLIEGLVQGAIGGLLAAGILWATDNLVQSTVVRNFSAMGGGQPFPLNQALILLSAAGAAYGLICSSIAVRETARPTRRPL
ncbi:MAG: ABC transporter permease [Fimbriimonadaceae bacterium]|nr:ABC transporter permease [Fimbriimonadaceae bacterium]QYK56764.1 MAG: ABC transporter permease [Fimbriimonadaceae bacterium]